MPDAVVVAIAKAVTTELATATLSRAIEPLRSYADWAKPLDDELPECGPLLVDVVPVSTKQESELQNSSELRYLVPIDIAVRQRFGTELIDKDTKRIAITEIDALMLLVQEIHELFTPKELTDLPDATWKRSSVLVSPHVRHLRESRQFTGVVRVTYRMEHLPG